MNITQVLRAVWVLVSSIVAAVAVVGVMTIVEMQLREVVPWYGTAASVWAGVVTGLLILGWRFGWKALIVAIVYVPLMYSFLLRAAIVIAGNFTGDWV